MSQGYAKLEHVAENVDAQDPDNADPLDPFISPLLDPFMEVGLCPYALPCA